MIARLIRAWQGRSAPSAPPQWRTPAEQATMVRNLMRPSLYRWTQENPGLQFDIEAEVDGGLRITATPAAVVQATYFIGSNLIGRCFDQRDPARWAALEASALAGILEAAKERGLI